MVSAWAVAFCLHKNAVKLYGNLHTLKFDTDFNCGLLYKRQMWCRHGDCCDTLLQIKTLPEFSIRNVMSTGCDAHRDYTHRARRDILHANDFRN